jgi:hypothetical protein
MRNIFFIGLISFPLIPYRCFWRNPALVGVIEGIAESLSSLLKIYLTNRFQKEKAIIHTKKT